MIPIDVYWVIAGYLDAVSICCLSMTCKALRDGDLFNKIVVNCNEEQATAPQLRNAKLALRLEGKFADISHLSNVHRICISNCPGIKFGGNVLRSVYLSELGDIDISALYGVPDVTLFGCEISDISPLSASQNVSLFCMRNVTHYPLNGVPNVVLCSCKIDDVSPLQNAKKIYMSGCSGKICNISLLRNVPCLTLCEIKDTSFVYSGNELELHRCKICDLSTISCQLLGLSAMRITVLPKTVSKMYITKSVTFDNGLRYAIESYIANGTIIYV